MYEKDRLKLSQNSPVADPCKHGNKTSNSLEGSKFLDHLF
jgi:hypothetical protein